MGNVDLCQMSATELSRLLADRSLSSRELLSEFAARIEERNQDVNAVVTLDLDHAMEAAAAADAATAAGQASGPLHGLPITVKDALAVAGMRSTGGATELRDHVPTADADVVAKVRAAGAIPFGKTNVPRWSGNLQTYNDVFGTTNNPWDTSRTPGGSSGGPGVSVALGFTSFEIGTDIGGSIRVPSAYCGVVGHKPSFGLVPCGGYLDRVDYGRTEPDVNVHGPIARSVDDLELLLDVIAGPRPDRAHAVSYRLPPARHARIDDYRIALWSDESQYPASAATVAAVEQAGELLGDLGAHVDRDARPALDTEEAFRMGMWLITSAVGPSFDDSTFDAFKEMVAGGQLPASGSALAEGVTASHREWQRVDVERTKLRERWAELFGTVDALVCPVVITPPFPHSQGENLFERVVEVDGVTRPYADLLFWTMLIGSVYLPATVVPVATTDDGLPVAVQIVGPYFEDRTPLAIARALREQLGPLTLPE
jgi:amidase